MTFKQAYAYAMEHSKSFREHDRKVREAMERKEQSACLIFGVSAGETFFYGFDGVDLHAGKHTKRRAKELFDRCEVLLIL